MFLSSHQVRTYSFTATLRVAFHKEGLKARRHTVEKSLSKTGVGWIVTGIGLAAAVTPVWATTTAAGTACTLGMGAFIAYFGVLALLTRNPTPMHWGFVVVGLALFIAPCVGGFAGDAAAWTAWVSGFVVLVLGIATWTHDHPPTESGINEYAINASVVGAWVGWPALVLGIATVVLAAVTHPSPVATCFTVGLGALVAVLALWSLLASDPTLDHLKLATTGFALFIAPWVAGFAGGSGAWMAWGTGFIVTALGLAGYLRGETLDYPRVVHDEAVATYRQRFP
jgi:hypothetical protein